MLAIDEVVDHVHGAGAVERVEGDQVFDAVRLIAAQDVAHPGGFELEHAAGERLAEDLRVGLLVVDRKFFHRQLDAAMALDQLEGIRDDGERGQAQEIHLEERQFLQAVHVVLRDNFVFVGLVERDDLAQRQRRNHHARRVDAGVARHALQALGHFENFFDFGIGAGQRIELRLHLARLLQLDVERHGGDQLGDAVDFAEAHVEHAAHVFDGGARAHGAEGDDLGHLLAPVFFGDVLNHFAAPAGAEIDIDIGHGDALGIQEALEQQPVGERIDVGDLHGVAD